MWVLSGWKAASLSQRGCNTCGQALLQSRPSTSYTAMGKKTFFSPWQSSLAWGRLFNLHILWNADMCPADWVAGVRVALLPLKGLLSATFIRDALSWDGLFLYACSGMCMCVFACPVRCQHLQWMMETSSKVSTHSPSVPVFFLDPCRRSPCPDASVPLWRHSRRASAFWNAGSKASLPVVDLSCLHHSGLEESWRITLCGPNFPWWHVNATFSLSCFDCI